MVHRSLVSLEPSSDQFHALASRNGKLFSDYIQELNTGSILLEVQGRNCLLPITLYFAVNSNNYISD